MLFNSLFVGDGIGDFRFGLGDLGVGDLFIEEPSVSLETGLLALFPGDFASSGSPGRLGSGAGRA